MHRFASVRLVGLVPVITALACSRSAPASPTPATGRPLSPGGLPIETGPPSARPYQTAILVGAGDIGDCANDNGRHAQETGRLLDKINGTVFVAGDAAYVYGSAADFANCFEPAWGRH